MIFRHFQMFTWKIPESRPVEHTCHGLTVWHVFLDPISHIGVHFHYSTVLSDYGP